MKEWEKYERDDLDKKKGWMLCPKCEGDTVEYLIDTDDELAPHYAERCSEGCYMHYFE